MGLFKKLAGFAGKALPFVAPFIPVIGPALSIGLKVRTVAMAAKKIRSGFIQARQAKRAASESSPFMGHASQFVPMRRRTNRRPLRRRRSRWG